MASMGCSIAAASVEEPFSLFAVETFSLVVVESASFSFDSAPFELFGALPFALAFLIDKGSVVTSIGGGIIIGGFAEFGVIVTPVINPGAVEAITG